MNPADYAELRLAHSRDQVAVVRAVTEGIVAARAKGTRRLLVDMRALVDLVPPTLAQRDALVTEWARAAAGQVVIAVLAPAALLDAERFGELIAAAAGLCAEGFEDEAAARAWLVRQRDDGLRVPGAAPAAAAPVRTVRR
jgi:hypothetical protein